MKTLSLLDLIMIFELIKTNRVLSEGLDVALVARVEEDGPLLMVPPGVVDEIP